jgi:hypothetical protein
MMSLLIGITLCFSLWHIMIQQEQYIVAPPSSFFNDSFVVYESPPSLIAFMDSAGATSDGIAITTATTFSAESLPKNDFRQLIDLTNFDFIINQKKCRNLQKPPLVVILVHSAPGNKKKRQTIRETWGEKNPNSILLFMLGGVNSTTLESELNMENQLHGDLVQGNFVDSYRNMTYKHVMALKWFIYECPQAQFLLKTDDDVFINSPMLYNILQNSSVPLHQQLHRDRLIYCHRIESAKVKRSYRSKWRVSYKEYSGRYFPHSCPGFAILYSSDAAFMLYQEAQKTPYFWIDDVHLTGTVASRLNLSITPFHDMYINESVQDDIMKGRLKVANAPFIFAQPNLVKMEIRKLWKLVGRNVSDSDVATAV